MTHRVKNGAKQCIFLGSSADKFIVYEIGAEFEKLFGIVLVPGSILVPHHHVQVEEKSQVDPISKLVKLYPVGSAKVEGSLIFDALEKKLSDIENRLK